MACQDCNRQGMTEHEGIRWLQEIEAASSTAYVVLSRDTGLWQVVYASHESGAKLAIDVTSQPCPRLVDAIVDLREKLTQLGVVA